MLLLDMPEPACAVDKALLLFCGFVLHWNVDGESLWLNLPIAGGTPRIIKVHEGKGMMDLQDSASTFKRPISDPRYIGRTHFHIQSHRTDLRLFAPFEPWNPAVLPHYFLLAETTPTRLFPIPHGSLRLLVDCSAPRTHILRRHEFHSRSPPVWLFHVTPAALHMNFSISPVS